MRWALLLLMLLAAPAMARCITDSAGRGGDANLERVLDIAPDLVLYFGSVPETCADLAIRTQAQTGIPAS